MFQSCPATDGEGLPLVHWFRLLTGLCVYGNLNVLSWIVQYVSVGVWVFSGTYQSYLCYKTKEVSGFSEYFLLCWIIGAVLNTLGCFLTDQMFFQKLLGVYFLFSDSFLYFQYKYYIKRPHLAVEVQHREKRKSTSYETTRPKLGTSDGITIERTFPASYSSLSSSSTSITPGILLGLAISPTGAKGAPIGDVAATAAVASTPTSSTSVLGFISHIFGASRTLFSTSGSGVGIQSWQFFGYLVGNSASWMSNSLYVISRVPQIHQNYQRKSTEGVSPALFIAVLVGNAAYTLAVATAWQAVTDPAEKAEFMVAEMPFIVGGIATTLADLIIFFQLYIYRNNVSALKYEIMEGIVVESDETSLLISPKKVGMYT